MEEFRIGVEWKSWGLVKIKANSLEEALKIAEGNKDQIPLPDGEYIDDSFKFDELENQKLLNPVEVKCDECGKYFNSEKIWNTERYGNVYPHCHELNYDICEVCNDTNNNKNMVDIEEVKMCHKCFIESDEIDNVYISVVDDLVKKERYDLDEILVMMKSNVERDKYLSNSQLTKELFSLYMENRAIFIEQLLPIINNTNFIREEIIGGNIYKLIPLAYIHGLEPIKNKSCYRNRIKIILFDN